MAVDSKKVIDALRVEVEAERDTNAAAVALIQGLVAEIKSAASQGDLQAVIDLTTQAHTQSSSLAAAIKANSASGAPNV